MRDEGCVSLVVRPSSFVLRLPSHATRNTQHVTRFIFDQNGSGGRMRQASAPIH
jgi:hypothetical protein